MAGLAPISIEYDGKTYSGQYMLETGRLITVLYGDRDMVEQVGVGDPETIAKDMLSMMVREELAGR